MKTIFTNLTKGLSVIALFLLFNNNLRAQVGECLDFDGGNDFVQVPSLSLGSNWTAEAWVNPSAVSGGWYSIIGQNYWGTTTGSGFVFAIYGGTVFLETPAYAIGQYVHIESSISANVWTHLAATYNNGIYAFYKNGILAGTQKGTYINAPTPFLMGMRTHNTATNTTVDPLDGRIDEVRIWNVTRSQCEIQSYMNCEISTTASLIANYHFNEGIANSFNINYTVTDASSNSNTGSMINFPPFASMNGSTSNWVSPGSPAQGLNSPTVPSPEINVKGNSVSISDGSGSPLVSDYTDFNGAPTRTFLIESTGTGTLNAGVPFLTGTNASEFTVTAITSTLLPATSGTANFVVAFTPTSLGAKTATVMIYNNDCSEPIYDFVITATAVAGAALNFDGVDDFVETNANLAELGQGDFTIEAWIKTTAVSQGIVVCANANATWEIGEKCLYLDGSGIPIFVGWGNNYIQGNLAVNNGAWHHVAVVWDYAGSGTSGVGKVYIDGVDHTGTVSYAANNNNVGTFKIGKQNYWGLEAPNPFNGEIDEVRIWNRVLCQPEIINNMNCELPSPSSYAGLNGYYRLNTGIANGVNTALSTATDLAVFTNDGTLTNFGLSGVGSNWSGPGGVLTGSTCSAYLDREINIQGNSVSIISGDATPSATDHTDFGNIPQGTVLSRTFVIQNSGALALSISAYSLSGANAGSFTITTNPAASIGAAGTGTIVVSYSASALGLQTASLTIANNDCDEGVYRFVINATAVAAGEALNLDGGNDYVSIAHTSSLNAFPLTVETWVKTSYTGFLAASLVGKYVSNSYDGWLIYLSNGTLSAYYFNNSSNHVNFPINATTSITDNNWHHVALVVDASGGRLYVDGILSSPNQPWTGTPAPPSTTQNVLIGSYDAYLPGSIDEVRIWNTARTQCEIQTYMNCEIPASSSGLMANYHFNQGAAGINNSGITTLLDAAGTNTGTLNNFNLNGATSNWISPGGVTMGSTTINTPTVEIEVTGNGSIIVDGTAASSVTDFTDFNGSITRTFVINNTITGGILNIAAPYLTGTNADQFTVTSLPAASINGIASTSFVVTFTPTSLGTKTAIININNNDCSESIYDFVITATTSPNGLDFDGIDDHVDFGSASTTIFAGTLPYTIEAWIKRKSGGAGTIACHHNTGVSASWNLSVNADGSLYSYRNLAPWTVTSAPNLIPEDVWTHVAVTFNGSALVLWINGVSAGSTTFGSQPSTTAPLLLGARLVSGTPADFFEGEIDEFKIWSVARSSLEINNGMVAELVGNETNLVAYYHFNKGVPSGTNTIYNTVSSLPAGITGTLTNFALTGCNSNWVCGAPSVGGCPNQQEITVSGNSVGIVSGTSTVSTTNFTDFGLLLTGATLTRTFVIKNNGALTLSISASNLSGSGASSYSITNLPAASIAGGGTTYIAVTFSPATTGLKSATLSITSNDCDESPYIFVIEGTGFVPGAALDFDGSDDVVSINNTTALDNLMTGNFSVEAWIKPTVSGFRTILSKGDGSGVLGTGEYIFQLNNSNQLSFFHTASNGWKYSTNAVSPGVWSHVAVTYDGTNIKFYINGVLDTYAPSATYSFTTGNNSVYIGRQGFACLCNKFVGSIDEVRVWNLSRTQCEIQAFMNCEIPTTATGLLANYHFNQGISASVNSPTITLTDAGGVNTGTLSGFSLSGSTSNWVAPGGVVSGNTASVAPSASIVLSGLSNPIANNSTTVTLVNGTDFGAASTRTFVIQNNNTGTLNIGIPFMTGANASEFSVTVLPALSLTTSATTSFVVTFTPTSTGVKNATVNIYNNDCNLPIFNFAIEGTPPPAAALNFDGSSDYIMIHHSPAFNFAAAMTIEAWIKNSSGTTEQPITTKSDDSWHLSINGGGGAPGKASFFLTGLSPTTWLYGTTNVSDGNWHHIAATYDGTSAKLFVDGKLDGQMQKTGTLATGSSSVFVGLRPIGSFYYPGDIDELRFWNVERSQCEIQSYMNCEIPTTASGLVANYHFNHGSPGLSNSTSTTLADYAGSSRTGTLTNFNMLGFVSNWVIPGGVTSGSITPAPPTASILVSGNSTSITPGSTTPSTLDFTDFGAAITRTFVIQNTATGTLNISAPLLTGINAADFSLTVLPSPTLTTSATTSFVVAFTPTSTGVKNATITIYSNDCNIPLYNFAIRGTPPTAEALDFDGADDYVDLGSGSAFKPTSALTAEAWVYSSTWPSTDQTILGNTENAGYGIFTRTTGYLEGLVRRNSTWGQVNTPLAAISPGWHHVALTYDGRFTRLYLDGILKATDDAGASYSVTYIGNNTLIGGEASSGSAPLSGWYFTGRTDEVRFWNAARTQCEIQTYMNCEIPAGMTSLTANYHFNQGSPGLNNSTITALTDVSGSSNTGTLNVFGLSGNSSNWVSPGAVTSGSTTAAVIASSLAITGNGSTITPGSTATSTNNFTNFGAVATRTFVVQNPGTGNLYLNGGVLSGVNAGDFSITTLPSPTLTTGATSSFVITFSPTALGTRSAVLTVYSSDCSVPEYSFVITATAVPGAALNFDGVDDGCYRNIFTAANNSITLQARVFMTANQTTNKIIAYNGISSSDGYGLYLFANSPEVNILYGGVAFLPTGYSLTLNQWNSLSMVIENSTVKFYANGLLAYSNVTVTPSVPTASFMIGVNQAGTENFNGSIDEVLFWGRPLSQCEIQAYLGCEIATSASSLLANYHFNQGIGEGVNTNITTVTDATGNGNHLWLLNLAKTGISSNFISNGAVVSGSSCPAFVAPEINILSNGINIVDGNTVTSTSDNTDFGNVSSTNNIVRTYTIQNLGGSNLAITTMSLSGANASSFTLGALSPASPIATASFAVFSVTYTPASVGTHSAVVTIINTDCDEGAYDFVIAGTATTGAALSFDGNNDYINCGAILPASYTKEGWFLLSAYLTNGNNLISGGSGSNGHALWASGLTGNKLSAGHNLGWTQVQDPNPLSLNQWYHVAVTYDAPSQTMILYKDGLVVGTSSTVPAVTGSDPLSIGAFSGNFSMSGAVDEVRIWNRVLCQTEIQNNMNCEIPSTNLGLIANYHFNQGIGYGSNITTTLVTDFSGSANTGTMVNFAATGTVSNWVSTSTVTTGSSCTPFLTPEINLIGNAAAIYDGATTPTVSNHTSFGSVCINTVIVRTYTIQNTGNTNLTVGTITMSGTDASMFTVGALTPASPVAAGSQAVFSVTFAPVSSGVKTATVNIANNDCNENPFDFAVTGTCNALPVITATTTNSVICNGAATILNGGGADTYTWTGGSPTVTNGVSFTPSVTLSYTVVGTNTLTGCTSTNLATQGITVNPNPTITLSANNSVICDGSPVTLTPGGADTYTLNPGGTSGTSFTVSPSTNTTYSVTGTSSTGCAGTNTATSSITVNPLPVVTATASSPVICSTGTTSLIGGGADTYTWTGGAVNGSSFTPATTTAYTVTGTYTLTGCTSTNLAVQTITVDPVPTVTATAANSVICDGATATLTASGAGTYTWNPGGFIGTVYTPAPSVFTTYTVSGTSSAGCTSTNLAVQSVSVNALPTVTASISNSIICEGSTVTVTGSGATTYLWSNGIIDGVAFTPTTSGSYSVTGTNSAGCTSTNAAVVSVTVNALPSLTINVTNSVICIGGQSMLDGSGALTYSWTGGISDNVAFTPTTTTSYTLTATDANNCVNTASTVITVNNLPALTVSGSPTVSCEAQTTTLTASGASSYTWNTNETTADIVITPTATTVYTVSATDVNTCTNTIVYTQSVTLCPGTFTAVATTTNISCNGKDDGRIVIQSGNSYSNSVLSYNWNPVALCPGNNCDTLKNLPSGTYYLTLKVTYTVNNTLVKMDSILLSPIVLYDLNGQCEIKVFSGVSANNDGTNDVMVIENIEEFPNNNVSIFNRWGQEIFTIKGYNNTDKVWPLKGGPDSLLPTTYFYFIDLGNGSKPVKGWVELTKD